MAWPLIRNLPKETHVKFVSLAPFAAALSGLAIAVAIVSFFLSGLNLGIEFRGGTQIQVATQGPAPL
ncbi:MAG TPA: protein translocase subunit SecF, partial [Caulobacteraceae bacterium]|nr:protein translocase subunit SecF [Caulobacteraceae bacterium]